MNKLVERFVKIAYPTVQQLAVISCVTWGVVLFAVVFLVSL